MNNVFQEKYINSLIIWQQKNNVLINTIENYHDMLKEEGSDFEQDTFFLCPLIDKNEVNFVKMLKRLNEIIEHLLKNNEKVIKYELLQKICSAYYYIDGVGTLRLDRIFDKVSTEQQYKETFNMIQQYIRMTEHLINMFTANIIQEKEFDVKGFKL